MLVCYLGCSEELHRIVVDEETNNTLNIPDMAPSDFECLKAYMYLGKINFCSVHQLCFGLYAAERFQLHDLRILCLRRLQSCIRENHSAAVELIDARFKFTILIENEHVFAEAVDIVKSNYEEVLISDCIPKISRDTIELLLHLVPNENVEEIIVFRALLKWVEGFCNRNNMAVTVENKRAAAGDMALAVQYNLMPADLIDSEVAPSGLLDDKLLVLAFRCAVGGSVASPFGKQAEKLAALLHQVRQLQNILS